MTDESIAMFSLGMAFDENVLNLTVARVAVAVVIFSGLAFCPTGDRSRATIPEIQGHSANLWSRPLPSPLVVGISSGT